MQLTRRKTPDYSFLNPVLDIVNRSRDSEYLNIKTTIKESEKNAAYYLTTSKDYEKKAEENKQRLANMKSLGWEMKDLIKSVNELKKHKKVKWAFIDKNLYLVILTEMLYAFNAIEERKTDEAVGRYIFEIDLRNPSSSYCIKVHALDFISQGYHHPNIMSHPGTPCWGGYNYGINKALVQGEFFNAVDMLIYFLSSFPQDEGSHDPKYWLVWLNEREVQFKPSDWVNRDRLYTINRFSKPKKIKIEVPEKKEKVTLNGKEIVIKGLHFRSY